MILSEKLLQHIAAGAHQQLPICYALYTTFAASRTHIIIIIVIIVIIIVIIIITVMKVEAVSSRLLAAAQMRS